LDLMVICMCCLEKVEQFTRSPLLDLKTLKVHLLAFLAPRGLRMAFCPTIVKIELNPIP
jgi:hypothetical protein